MEPAAHTLIYQLRLLFALERTSRGLIRKVAKHVADKDFSATLGAKDSVSTGQVSQLKQCIQQVGGTVTRATSSMIDGAAAEFALLLEHQRKDTQRDLQICCLIQAVVHYKLSICESTIAHARAQNLPDAELLLLGYLGEERTFDASLALWRDTAIGATPAGLAPAK